MYLVLILVLLILLFLLTRQKQKMYTIQEFKAMEDDVKKALNESENPVVKNQDLFQRRILGTLSYYRTTGTEYFPTVLPNNIQYLPDEIGRIHKLRVLNLSSNRLKYLPCSICKLKELQALWLTENQVIIYN